MKLCSPKQGSFAIISRVILRVHRKHSCHSSSIDGVIDKIDNNWIVFVGDCGVLWICVGMDTDYIKRRRNWIDTDKNQQKVYGHWQQLTEDLGEQTLTRINRSRIWEASQAIRRGKIRNSQRFGCVRSDRFILYIHCATPSAPFNITHRRKLWRVSLAKARILKDYCYMQEMKISWRSEDHQWSTKHKSQLFVKSFHCLHFISVNIFRVAPWPLDSSVVVI